MILSRLELNLNKVNTLKALKNPNIFHGIIQNALADDKKRCLWRIDILNSKHYLLIVSEDEIKYPHILENNFGGVDQKLESKNYDSFLKNISKDSYWRFKIKINPVKREFNPKKKNTSYRPCFSTESQINWLEKRSLINGFELIQIIPTGKEEISFTKKTKNKVRLLSITFEGILKVTNPNEFIKVLKNGLGHGKAYGLGMMSVVKVK